MTPWVDQESSVVVLISARQQWAVTWSKIFIPCREIEPGGLDENQEPQQPDQQGQEARS